MFYRGKVRRREMCCKKKKKNLKRKTDSYRIVLLLELDETERRQMWVRPDHRQNKRPHRDRAQSTLQDTVWRNSGGERDQKGQETHLVFCIKLSHDTTAELDGFPPSMRHPPLMKTALMAPSDYSSDWLRFGHCRQFWAPGCSCSSFSLIYSDISLHYLLWQLLFLTAV